jgi:tetratricopeptide (TPR) repeat protein
VIYSHWKDTPFSISASLISTPFYITSLYATATDFFSQAKGGELQTPHPYDCEARMHFYRAQRNTEAISKALLLLKALDTVYEAEDNLPEENLPRLLDLRAQIREALRTIPDFNNLMLKLAEMPGHQIDGVLARAKLTLLDPLGAKADKERALGILENVVPSNPNNPVLLRTYYKLTKDLYPDNRESLYKILNMRYQITSERRNFSLLYDLGVLSFSFGDYPKSFECFRQLEKLSQGHPKRWGVLDRGTDKDGKKREFRGTVITIESASGYVDIPELRRKVPFLPLAQEFVPQPNQTVSFNVGFNYRGWLAVDLKK